MGRFEIPDAFKPRFKLRPGQVLRRCKSTPDTLLELCIAIVDKFPLPKCFDWTAKQIAEWIARVVGFPQYAAAFYINKIDGKKLMFVDASALPRMNIHDFEHIKIITSHIRHLVNRERDEFGRSISLPYMYPETCYRIFRSRTGPITESTKRSKFWRDNHILRPSQMILNHWAISCKVEPFPCDAFGYMPRYQLYKAKPKPRDLQETPTANVEPPQDEWDVAFDKIVEVVHKPRMFHIMVTSLRALQEQGGEGEGEQRGADGESEPKSGSAEQSLKKRVCRGPCKGMKPNCADE